jgi:hypothetical protein
MWFAIPGAFDFLQTYNAAITAPCHCSHRVFTYFWSGSLTDRRASHARRLNSGQRNSSLLTDQRSGSDTLKDRRSLMKYPL